MHKSDDAFFFFFFFVPSFAETSQSPSELLSGHKKFTIGNDFV